MWRRAAPAAVIATLLLAAHSAPAFAAAPCVPNVTCLPLPVLPTPQASAQPFSTPTPSARPTPSPSPTQAPGPTPGPGTAPAPGQDVGVINTAVSAANGAAGLSKQVSGLLTAPAMSGDWFAPLYQRVVAIALYVLLFALLAAVVQFLVHRRLGIVAGSWFGWAPASIGITATNFTLTVLALGICDGLCAYIMQGVDVPGFLEHLAVVLGGAADGGLLTGQLAFVLLLLGLLIVLAVLGIMVELLMRQVVVYVCLLWMPLSAAASVWAPARHWLYRLAVLQFSVIFSKFAIVTVLALGVAAFAANPQATGPLGEPNLAAIVMGLVVCVLALSSPLLLLGLLPHDFSHRLAGASERMRGAAWRLGNRARGAVATRIQDRKAAEAGLPIASKAARTGTSVVPVALVVRGGQVVAARGGRVLRASGQPPQPPLTPRSRSAGKSAQPTGASPNGKP